MTVLVPSANALKLVPISAPTTPPQLAKLLEIVASSEAEKVIVLDIRSANRNVNSNCFFYHLFQKWKK